MIIRAKTFDKWIEAHLKESLEDIANHGANSGFPEITYYRDTVALYDKFKEEIWDALWEDHEEYGNKHVLELIASFNGAKDVGSDEQFKNLLVWYYVERYAHRKENEEWNIPKANGKYGKRILGIWL